jgi:hypothetical protein
LAIIARANLAEKSGNAIPPASDRGSMARVKKKAPTKRTAAPKTAAKRPATKKAATKKTTAATSQLANEGAPKKPRVFAMSFASVYPLYLQKAAKKGRTKMEVDEVISWLTGYKGRSLQRALDTKVDLETFFAEAPRMNPNARLITGVVCGVRVEDVADPSMQKIRYLDKLIDELAKGKELAAILRQ